MVSVDEFCCILMRLFLVAPVSSNISIQVKLEEIKFGVINSRRDFLL